MTSSGEAAVAHEHGALPRRRRLSFNDMAQAISPACGACMARAHPSARRNADNKREREGDGPRTFPFPLNNPAFPL
jgi:hypothetical protein